MRCHIKILYLAVSIDLRNFWPCDFNLAARKDAWVTGLHSGGAGGYAQAEPLYQRALVIREKALGPEHPHVAESLYNLAGLYKAQGRYAEADPFYQRALMIVEKALGPEHPDVATSLENYAALLRETGRADQAERMEARAKAIRSKSD